ncbi:MAG TPA: NUDIX hydrolase [Candidatus Dojkabacteria bacterium]|nr:NUDIX hydrolase [Candidatus Dojkabacteria bacterium]
MREFRKNTFISDNGTVKSFSLRASALIVVGNKYLMVLNEGAKKYKHPGGHVHINESLLEGLKRELKEEVGLKIETANTEELFFDSLFKDGSMMINTLFQIEISLEEAEEIISNSPMKTKLFTLEELNDQNTWESEIEAIKYYQGSTLGKQPENPYN